MVIVIRNISGFTPRDLKNSKNALTTPAIFNARVPGNGN
jgi:hypothetical protein